MKVPTGTQSGETRRLRGRGIRHIRQQGAGDQCVCLLVQCVLVTVMLGVECSELRIRNCYSVLIRVFD